MLDCSRSFDLETIAACGSSYRLTMAFAFGLQQV